MHVVPTPYQLEQVGKSVGISCLLLIKGPSNCMISALFFYQLTTGIKYSEESVFYVTKLIQGIGIRWTTLVFFGFFKLPFKNVFW